MSLIHFHSVCHLIRLGSDQILTGDNHEQAMVLFDAAHSMIVTPSVFSADVLNAVFLDTRQVEGSSSHAHGTHTHTHVQTNTHAHAHAHTHAHERTHADEHAHSSSSFHHDIYQDGACDVGPRMLRNPVVVDPHTVCKREFVESIILFNKGLIYEATGRLQEAKLVFEIVASTLQEVLLYTTAASSTAFLELSMRTFNNLGYIEYVEKKEGLSSASFEAAVHFAKQLLQFTSTQSYRLEYATSLSNWCRVTWLRGHFSECLVKGLEDVLLVRASNLSWDHPDVAATRFNIGVVEYGRQNSEMAASQMKQYLAIAAHRSKEHKTAELDVISALAYLLLIEYERKEDTMSQELVRGLRTLQDKRQDEGSNSPDLAAVLNYIGAILFHLKDFENALLFFWDELRLEDQIEGRQPVMKTCDEMNQTTSVRVTCNNIGRILQELGRFNDAMHYYERALNVDFGNINDTSPILLKAISTRLIVTNLKENVNPQSSTENSVNLYSTVWYNLGLINDKLGFSDKAIAAFEISHVFREAILGPDHSDVACLLYNIGVLQMETTRLSDASASFRKALRNRQVGAKGQLNDRHVLKTLKRLAALHESKGDFVQAAEAFELVLSIQQVSHEFDEINRLKEMGCALRSIADIYEAADDLYLAIKAATESVFKLRIVVDQEHLEDDNSVPASSHRFANIEQLVSSLLLLGSLYHGICEPLKAENLLGEAAALLLHEETFDRRNSLATFPSDSSKKSSIHALRGVTTMLATCHCAAKA